MSPTAGRARHRCHRRHSGDRAGAARQCATVAISGTRARCWMDSPGGWRTRHVLPCNLSDTAESRRWCGGRRRDGEVDILVACRITRDNLFGSCATRTGKRMPVNMTATFRLAGPDQMMMRKRFGRIIGSHRSSRLPATPARPTTPLEGEIIGLIKTLGAEYASAIDSQLPRAGFIKTPMTDLLKTSSANDSVRRFLRRGWDAETSPLRGLSQLQRSSLRHRADVHVKAEWPCFEPYRAAEAAKSGSGCRWGL